MLYQQYYIILNYNFSFLTWKKKLKLLNIFFLFKIFLCFFLSIWRNYIYLWLFSCLYWSTCMLKILTTHLHPVFDQIQRLHKHSCTHTENRVSQDCYWNYQFLIFSYTHAIFERLRSCTLKRVPLKTELNFLQSLMVLQPLSACSETFTCIAMHG